MNLLRKTNLRENLKKTKSQVFGIFKWNDGSFEREFEDFCKLNGMQDCRFLAFGRSGNVQAWRAKKEKRKLNGHIYLRPHVVRYVRPRAIARAQATPLISSRRRDRLSRSLGRSSVAVRHTTASSTVA